MEEEFRPPGRQRRRGDGGGRRSLPAVVLVLVFIAALVLVIRTGRTTGPAQVQPGRQATRIVGPLTVQGTRIVDRGTGRPVRLLGIDDTNMVPGSGPSLAQGGDRCGLGWRPLTDSGIASIRLFGFNSFRLGVSWANLEPAPPTVLGDGSLVHHWNTAYLEALGAEIQSFARHGIAVIPDMHRTKWSPALTGVFRKGSPICEGAGMPAWLYPNLPHPAPPETERELSCQFFGGAGDPSLPITPLEGYVAAWRELASFLSRFQNAVGADMINEPTTSFSCHADAMRLAQRYETIGRSIHAVAPRLLLVYEDNPFGQYQTDGTALLSRPDLPGGVYSFHFYPRDAVSGFPFLETALARSRQWRVPLWLGEMNPMLKSVDPGDDEGLKRTVAFCTQQGISWAYFNIGILRGQLREGHISVLDDLRAGF